MCLAWSWLLWTLNRLPHCITTQCRELVQHFFLSLAQNRRVPLQNLLWLQNLTETNCFADVKIFHVYLIQIYFEYKYLQELWFLDWNTEGFKSIGFDIPLYASLNVRNLHFWLRLAKKRREPLFFMYSTLFGLFSLLLTLWLPG